MYPFPIEKYKFFVHDNEVIATTTYAGKRVRAVARCAPGDIFNVEKGKELAATRCAMKVAKKRYQNAKRKLLEADRMVSLFKKHQRQMEKYFDDAANQVYDVEETLLQLEDDLKN